MYAAQSEHQQPLWSCNNRVGSGLRSLCMSRQYDWTKCPFAAFDGFYVVDRTNVALHNQARNEMAGHDAALGLLGSGQHEHAFQARCAGHTCATKKTASALRMSDIHSGLAKYCLNSLKRGDQSGGLVSRLGYSLVYSYINAAFAVQRYVSNLFELLLADAVI